MHSGPWANPRRKPYICIHVFTTQQWPSLWLREGITPAMWHPHGDPFTPPHKHVAADPPSPFSLWSFGLGDWHCTTDRRRLWLLYWLYYLHCDNTVTWYFMVVHIASFMAPAEHWEKTHFISLTALYVSIMVIFNSWFLCRISGKNLSSADLTIHWITMFLVLILISFWCVLPHGRGRLMHSYQ